MDSFQNLGLTVIVLVIVASDASLQSTVKASYPIGAYQRPELFQPEASFCPRDGMVSFTDAPPLLTPGCVSAPGPVRCHLQTMTTGQQPRWSICRNKGYLSGWTRVPPQGTFFIKCCSSPDYTYSDSRCVIRVRTEQNSGSNLPHYFFPVGAKALRGQPAFALRYCVFLRRRTAVKPKVLF